MENDIKAILTVLLPLLSQAKKDSAIKETTGYRREMLRLIELLYRDTVERSSKYMEYGNEIIETVKYCVASFDPDLFPASEKENSPDECDRFLRYFRASVRKNCERAIQRELFIRQYGFVPTREVLRYYRLQRLLSDYFALSRASAASVTTEQIYAGFAAARQLTLEEVKKIADFNIETAASLSPRGDEDDDGTGIDLPDPDSVTPEDSVIAKESRNALMNRIEVLFDQLQNRQKTVVSKVFTAKFWSLLTEEDRKRSFVDIEILTESQKLGAGIPQAEVAKRLGRLEASVSRSLNDFVRHLKAYSNREDEDYFSGPEGYLYGEP